MYTQISFKSIKEFMYNNKKIYLLSALISILIFLILIGYNWKISNKEVVESAEEVSFLLENKEGNPVQNPEDIRRVLLLQLHSDNSVGNDIKEELNDNLKVFRDASNFFTVSVDNYDEKDNILVKDKILSYLNQNDIEYFNDKHIMNLSENPKELFNPTLENNEFSIKKIVAFILGAIILIFILGTILSAIFSKKNKLITDDFSFLSKDTVINISHFPSIDKQKCISSIINNVTAPTIVITKLLNLDFKEMDKVVVTESLENTFDDSINPTKVLIICEKGNTTKEWYQLQLELAKIYTDAIDIIII
ncbi:hypothetical protein [Enterococcus mundtii]|uniref:hypothetical protein n=1 Tax=Enterococcus mundtii TaxID=53346 RepID=UPI000305DF64|nr:hypothetical protein [Enterococcus mundtii]OBS62130.1 hypothetical protein AX758_11500 [Enterococcus mundtii]